MPSADDVARIGEQCLLPGDGVDPALGRTAERRDPLGEQIAKFFRGLGDLVEELVEDDKVWSLDIPVGLFGLPPRSMTEAKLRLSNVTGWSRIE